MLQVIETLQMSVAKNPLNRHEFEIFHAIEKEDRDGINVRGLQEKYGFAPNTLIKYLDTLENSHRLIYSEKFKNSLIYKTRLGDQPTRLETQEFVKSSIPEIEKLVNSSIQRAEKWSISDQMEVYHNVVNVLVFTRYLKKFVTDISEHPISEDEDKFFDELDKLTKKVNENINLILSPLMLFPLIKTVDESISNLEKVSKGRKIRKSKHIKKLEPKLNKTLKKVHDKLKKLDDKGFFK